MSARHAVAVAVALIVLASAGTAGGATQAPQTPDPTQFTTNIDHPFWPMRPGSRWVYREVEDGARQRVVVTVTGRTRKLANGVTARVVRDVVSKRGKPVEITDDWYAQDRDGNLWYMGEDTAEYRKGRVVSRDGSWEAGKDGAEAGILLPAQPVIGMEYRQEYLEGEAEDRGRILSLDEQVEVHTGHYTGVLMTRDWTPLEPDVLEHKFYARGVGPVLTLAISGGAGREELRRYRR